MKVKYLLIACTILGACLTTTAQVKIGDNPDTINPASVLEIESTTKGVLLPRMSETQRDAISSPPTGLWLFNTTVNMPQYYDGTGWTTVADQKAYGSFAFEANATATTFTASNTFVKVIGASTGGSEINDFETTTNGRLTYIGSKPKHFHIVCNISVFAASNNENMAAKIAKNGVPAGTMLERKLGTSNDIGAFAVHADFMLSNGDYLELFIRNQSSTTSLTVRHLYLFAMSMN